MNVLPIVTAPVGGARGNRIEFFWFNTSWVFDVGIGSLVAPKKRGLER